MKVQYGAVERMRQERGLSIQQLSEETGIAISTIIRVESGQHRVYGKTLETLAQYFKVPVPDLVEPVDPSTKRASAFDRGYRQALDELRLWATAGVNGLAFDACDSCAPKLVAKLDEMQEKK